jgi:SAM-dependent methyltransferase
MPQRQGGRRRRSPLPLTLLASGQNRMKAIARRHVSGTLNTDTLTFTSDGIYFCGRLAKHLSHRLYLNWPSLFSHSIPITKLLMGGECLRTAATHSRNTGNMLRASTPITSSPHFDLLKLYEKAGDSIFNINCFAKTLYYQNALECIKLYGDYFGYTDDHGIIARARKFTSMMRGEPFDSYSPGETLEGQPVIVRRINHSDCFEIVDGHHRISIAAMQGSERYRCVIPPNEPAITPVQQMVMESLWTGGRRELYQPINLPELATWPVMRRCSDRFEMMCNALAARGITSGSYLDVCSSYGWFVAEMAKLGFQAAGVDRDRSAVAVGQVAYGLDTSAVCVSDVVKYLKELNSQFDIVSCYSITHHFVLGSGQISGEEFIRLVDGITRTMLFFDTGEAHENWFRGRLDAWTPEFVKNWLLSNTSFKTVEILGTDSDDSGVAHGNYGRHLFACYRS